jgi:hypothetical protein
MHNQQQSTGKLNMWIPWVTKAGHTIGYPGHNHNTASQTTRAENAAKTEASCST